jgi:uncharacterized cupin superfamily protein
VVTAGPYDWPVEKLNIFQAENVEDRIDVSGALGSKDLLMFIYDLAPGESSGHYHYEYDEEWLLVVEGTVVLRAPDGEHVLERGDLIRFPAGPAGAHKQTNRSDKPARTLMFSKRGGGYAVSVYPDTDEVCVWAGGEDDLVFKRSSAVPWTPGK